MAFDKDKKITPVFFGSINETFDERGSMYLALRKTQWVREGQEPDESKAKYEIRKWVVGPDGDTPNKGTSFLTDNGPNELAHVLLKNGFGDTKQCLLDLKTRDDFKDAVKHMYDAETDTDGEFFDAREMLLKENPDEDENE